MENGKVVTYFGKDALYEQSVAKPIADRIIGPLLYFVEANKAAVADPMTRLELTFRDITGRAYVAEDMAKERGDPLHFPGLETKVTEPPPLPSETEQERLELEKKRLALEYAVSATIIYQDQRLVIINRGRTDLSVWGTVYGDKPVTVDKEPRVIAPNDNYYLFAEQLERQMTESLGDNASGTTPCYVFVTSSDSKKHTINYILLGKKDANGVLTIHTQNLGVTDGWGVRPLN
jgi:hypothetical protein